MKDRLAADAALLLRLGLAGLAITLVTAFVLRGREALVRRRPILGIVLGALAMTSGALLYASLFARLLPEVPRDPVVAGAFIGLAAGGSALAIAVPVVAVLFVLDPAFRVRIHDPWMTVWLSAAGLVACAIGGILLFQLWLLMRRSVFFALFAVPLSLALFPFVRQLFQVPVLLAALRRRQQQLEPPVAGELRAWSDGIARTYRLGRLEVLFGPKAIANAAAVGFRPFTRFIMIGDGLTSAMPPRELKAILAHEVAHVLRGDVRNKQLLWVGLGTIWIYLSAVIRVSLDLRGPLWAAASGLGMLGTLAIAFRYSRHCELAADRLAAELIDSPDDMRAALARMGELTKFPVDRRSPTHPSLDERLAALNSR